MYSSSVLIDWLIHDSRLDYVHWCAKHGARETGYHCTHKLNPSIIWQFKKSHHFPFTEIVEANVA